MSDHILTEKYLWDEYGVMVNRQKILSEVERSMCPVDKGRIARKTWNGFDLNSGEEVEHDYLNYKVAVFAIIDEILEEENSQPDAIVFEGHEARLS